MRRRIITSVGRRCFGCAAVAAWSPPDANRKHSDGLQSSVHLGDGAMTHETSRSRATTVYYDGAGVHDNLVSMMVIC